MFLLPIILLLLGTPQRPMSEMQGDCDQYGLDLTREFKSWEKHPQKVSAQPDSENASRLSLGDKTSVFLQPMHQVSFLSPPPEGKRGFEGTYGGMVRVKAGKKGSYRFCMSTKVWLDVVDPTTGTPLKNRLFEMQTQCDRIFKVVVFDLEPEREYLLQLAFCRSAQMQMLITRETSTPAP